MNYKTVAGIFCILLGSLFSTFAQSTAYANVFAEVIAPVGIENTSVALTENSSEEIENETVILIEVNSLDYSNELTDQWQSGIQATIKITADPQTILDISLSEQYVQDNQETISQAADNTMTSVSIPAQPLQNAHGVVRIGAAMHLTEGTPELEHPVIITLNCN